MRSRVVRALLLLELRRAREVVPRAVLAAAGLSVVLALLGWLTPPRLTLLLGIAAATGAAHGPMSVLRDKVDGGLEFLTSLPASPSEVVAGRFAYAVLAAVPAGVGVSLALVPAGAGELAAVPLAPWSVHAGGVVLVLVFSLLSIGCALRFDVVHFGRGVALLLFVAVALEELGPRLVPDPQRLLRWLLERPGAGLALGLATAAAVVAICWISFRLARAGVERFTPGRDRLGW